MITAVSGIKAPAFKGNVGETETKSHSIKDVSGQVDKFTKEANETVDSLSTAMTTATSGLGTLGTSAIGLWALFKSPFKAIADFFSKAKVDANGQVIRAPKLDKAGKEILDEAGEVVTEVVKTANWKRIGIAGAAIAGVGAVFGINKANKAKRAQQADELKHQQELREIQQQKEIEAAKATVSATAEAEAEEE